jgi:hypothetical protein
MTYQPSEEEIKHRRDVYLQASDIYVLPDRWDTYTQEQKTDWANYRQALRDLPTQPEFPATLTWPASPVDLGIGIPEGWPPEWA